MKRKLDELRANAKVVAHLGGDIEDNECEVEILAAHPYRKQRPGRKVRGVVDTGCQATALREDIVAALALPKIDEIDVVCANGQSDRRDVVLAHLTLAGIGEPLSIRWPVISSTGEDEILFGVDLLDGGILILDRLIEMWEIRYLRTPTPDGKARHRTITTDPGAAAGSPPATAAPETRATPPGPS